MNVVREITKINERELELGLSDSASWHYTYRNSAYIFLGGIDTDLTEGDLIAVFSQFGEIVDFNLVRDKTTGKSLGYGFAAYEDQRSTVLAIDNMNGYQLCSRTLRVDHADKYRRPKGEHQSKNKDDVLAAEEDDKEYDARRKKIWDYEKYNRKAVEAAATKPTLAIGEVPKWVSDVHGGDPSAIATSSTKPPRKKEDRAANRVLAMLQKRKEQERLEMEQPMNAADAAAAASSSSSSLPQPAAAASSSSSSRHSREDEDDRRSSSRKHHDRSPRSSRSPRRHRSRSRESKRDKHRSSRDREDKERSERRDEKDGERSRDRDRSSRKRSRSRD